MARVAIPEMDQISDELKERFQKMEKNGHRIINIFKVVAHCPKVGRDFMHLGNAILFKGILDSRLRELAILRVGAIIQSNYEWTQHVVIGRNVGLTEEQIDALGVWQDSSHFNAHEQAVLQYTDEVTDCIRVSDKTFQGIKAFLTDEQIVELTITIGYYGMVCRILESLEIELEQEK